jgi:hypothetical protein
VIYKHCYPLHIFSFIPLIVKNFPKIRKIPHGLGGSFFKKRPPWSPKAKKFKKTWNSKPGNALLTNLNNKAPVFHHLSTLVWQSRQISIDEVDLFLPRIKMKEADTHRHSRVGE